MATTRKARLKTGRSKCDPVLAERINERMREMNISAAKLGMAVNIDTSAVRSWLAGDTAIDDETFTEICDLLNICE